MKFDFKNVIKRTMAVSMVVLSVCMLTGCASFAKKKALYEYANSLSSDAANWQALQTTMNQMNSTSDPKLMVSYAKVALDYLEKVKDSAVDRNNGITDPEIKDIDDSYVEAVTKMYNGYKMMIEGVEEYDQKKLDTGSAELENGAQSLKDYITKMQDFCDKYNIPADDKLQEALDLLG